MLGDIDGDGWSEVGVAIPRMTDAAGVMLGAVVVLSGRSGAEVLRAWGSEARGGFGTCLGTAGDCDQDGVQDLFVGAFGEDRTGEEGRKRGSVVIVSGATGERIRSVEGEASDSGMGWFSTGITSKRGGGATSLAFCCIGKSEGAVPSAPLLLRARPVRGEGPTWDASIGIGTPVAFTGVGDLDMDGISDIGLTVNTPPGKAGAGNAVVRGFSGASGKVLLSPGSKGQGPNHGRVLSGGGDLDGDGVPDLVIGTPSAFREGRQGGETEGPARTGTVTAVSGRSGEVLWERSVDSPWKGEQIGGILSVSDPRSERLASILVLLPGLAGDEGRKGAQGVVELWSGGSGTRLRTVAMERNPSVQWKGMASIQAECATGLRDVAMAIQSERTGESGESMAVEAFTTGGALLWRWKPR